MRKLRIPLLRVAGASTMPSEPLLMDAPAGESWADKGLRDIESRLLTDHDGDEAHEFVVLDPVVRIRMIECDLLKGARGSFVPSHSCVLE